MALITAPVELAKLRRSGRIAAEVLATVAAAVKPGVTTKHLDDIAAAAIRAAGATASFLGFQDYPASLCVSIKDEVVHGIPADRRVIRDGDLVGLDIGVNFQGLFSDHAVTVPVGQVDPAARRLVTDAKEALAVGLRAIKAGATVGDISAAIEGFLKPKGYGIVTQLTGHGLGYSVHEPPAVPNVGQPGAGQKLAAGLVLAIEPMVGLGRPEVETADDGWTVVMRDHSPAAHFEHTILVTENGCEILTRT